MEKGITYLVITCLAASLICNGVFGSPTLASYFFSSCLLLVASIVLSIHSSMSGGFFSKPPAYMALFALFFAFILFHDRIKPAGENTYYYWLCLLIFLFTFHHWFQKARTEENIRLTLYKGITAIALIEAVIVVLQVVKLLPSANKFFSRNRNLDKPERDSNVSFPFPFCCSGNNPQKQLSC